MPGIVTGCSSCLTIPARVNRRRRQRGLAGILPETRFYTWLLEYGVRRTAKGLQSEQETAVWHEWLAPALRASVIDLLNNGLWIPQESLGIAELKELS